MQQMLTVRVCRRKRQGTSKRCESFAEWVPGVQYAKMRFYYALRRQPFMDYTVDDDGVFAVEYWGPVTMRRAMNIVKSIPVHPNAPYGQRTVS